MKGLMLIIFFLGLGHHAFSQDSNTYIDTKYRLFSSGYLTYYQNNERLTNSELNTLMELNSETKAHLDKALKNKKIGTPLIILATAGLVTSLFIEDSSTQALIGLSSAGVGLVGSIFQMSYSKNLQNAVNLYNKNLIRNQKTSMRFDFKVDPMATGLVLRF